MSDKGGVLVLDRELAVKIKPLDRFPFIRTTDVDEMREAIAKTYGGNKLQPHRGAEEFRACVNHRLLRNIVLSYVTFGATVDQEFSAFTGFVSSFDYEEAPRSLSIRRRSYWPRLNR